MQVLYTGADWKKHWLESLKNDKSIGLVPTMGALHEGHLDLVRKAKEETDIVIVSIFVNPTQFNNKEDFDNYPTTLDQDLDELKSENVDFVFTPTVASIYPAKPTLNIHFGDLETRLEGAFRPGHFNGVGIVVSKLFNIIKPHFAYFGQKDLQQTGVINTLIRDLSMDVELVIVPTRREDDGLAMSSRNVRLSSEERNIALVLITSLRKAKKALLESRSWYVIQQQIFRDFESMPTVNLEYFELVHPESFMAYEKFDASQKSTICVAAYIGEIRLIDNLQIIR